MMDFGGMAMPDHLIIKLGKELAHEGCRRSSENGERASALKNEFPVGRGWIVIA